jgi:peptidyl-tRNA hydrolase, PTH1 family
LSIEYWIFNIQYSTSATLYPLKPQLVIIGLGNPGAAYERTRHNAGFQALDVLSTAFGEGDWKDSGKFTSLIQEGRILTAPILLVKPHTFMNRSGEAARKIVDFYKLNPKEQLLVITDDIDLPLGHFRLRRKGGPGTHNGMKSLVEQFGEDFPRLRVGLGAKPVGGDLSNWVLSAPPAEEQEQLDKAYAAFPEIVRAFVLGEGDGE